MAGDIDRPSGDEALTLLNDEQFWAGPLRELRDRVMTPRVAEWRKPRHTKVTHKTYVYDESPRQWLARLRRAQLGVETAVDAYYRRELQAAVRAGFAPTNETVVEDHGNTAATEERP